MSLQFVIDGYNIVRHERFPSSHKIKNPPQALISLIESNKLCGSRKNKITVVFDGYPKAFGSSYADGYLDVVFSCDISADERIRKIVEQARVPRNIVVVSDDREIQAFSKMAGAAVVGAEDFLWRKENARRRNKPDALKSDLTYSEMSRITFELKKLWLKEE
jgi:predicted RNA-binding protein with PIN domain